MTYLEKLSQLRSVMKEQGVDAYIIPSSDPHISEYLPEHYKCIAFTSGFTGSAGTLAVTQDFAGLWTDSRYFVQADSQLKDTGFSLVKVKVQYAPEFVDWIATVLHKGDTVAFDGNLASLGLANYVKSTLLPLGIKVDGHKDLLDPIWKDRPSLPLEPVYTLDQSQTGESTTSKLARLKDELKKRSIEHHLVSSLDDLAWLLNIRGTDVKCNPVTLGFVYVNQDKTILFIDNKKISQEVANELSQHGVELKPYDKVKEFLSELPAGDKILLDPKRTCFSVYDSVPSTMQIVEDINPTTHFKSVKNPLEIEKTRQAMINDGIAMTKFFMWIEQNVGSGKLSEMSIADHLESLRAEQPGFKSISFDTIAGYKAHGALPHYKAELDSNSTLQSDGLLLVDSGGQYLSGTTDITRVVSLGNITAMEKQDYTIVLKGMIEGSMAIFLKGIRGYQIDAIVRRPIWATKRNYLHGTGHGVGFFMNVHEGPHTFNGAAVDIAIQPGMISSIEPGLYREGQYGIRIENLVLARDLETTEFGDFMDFETLTICYIATDLVDKTLLAQEHIDWLNNYNAWVYTQLEGHLSSEEKQWLKEKTSAI
ncbi:aminopeptidase P family protein [Myroides sp. LJL116]